MVIEFTWFFQRYNGLGVDSACNRNEYQESSWGRGKGRTARKADNLTAICEPIVYKMWEPRLLRNLWTSTACYTDSFTLTVTSYLVCKIYITA
jgi:hypothetical protein